MKALLEFNLPEEREDFQLTQKAGAMASALEELYQYKRSLCKYDERDSLPKDEVVGKLEEILNWDN